MGAKGPDRRQVQGPKGQSPEKYTSPRRNQGKLFMRNALALVLFTLFITTGCNVSTPPPDPDAAAPPPMTKEEVLVQIKPIVDPLRQNIRHTGGERPPRIDEAVQDQILADIRQAKTQYGHEQFAQEAFHELAFEVAELAKEAAADERWRIVIFCVDVYETLGLESVMLRRLDERGEQVMSQPKIAVKGFMTDEDVGDTYVFIELTDRRTKQTKSFNMREREELYDVRLLEIVGNNAAVRLEYLKIEGLIFEVPAF